MRFMIVSLALLVLSLSHISHAADHRQILGRIVQVKIMSGQLIAKSH